MKFEYQEYKIINNEFFMNKYAALYSSLSLYYPVGLKSSDEKYKSFIGQKALIGLIEDRIGTVLT